MSRILGKGLLIPFQRDGKGDFANANDEQLVRSAVIQVVGTNRGEVAWRFEFGSDVERLRHRPNDFTTRELARVMVQQALRRWAPRVRVASVRLEELGEEPTELRMIVSYEIITNNTPGNRVIQEAVVEL